ncbi:hypothetical protein AMECASPLE_024343 [Ameca splendens]|uniref:Uncharacterized protein n=1 Tax=Ameca splendens TaxID=208324 RepID=A0ABV0Y4B4_9TELE
MFVLEVILSTDVFCFQLSICAWELGAMMAENPVGWPVSNKTLIRWTLRKFGHNKKEELQCKISEANAVTTFEENRDSEMEKIRNFDCKCYGRRKENSSLGTQSCSHKLSPEIM